jgi:hypothetical protein
LRVEGQAAAGTEGQAACNAAIVIASLYSALLTPVELAVLTGDPDPVVQIVVGGTVLDSAPHGVSELTKLCYGFS